MKELISHKVNGLNDALKIEVIDEPRQGNACHRYDLSGFDTTGNASSVNAKQKADPVAFQEKVAGGFRSSFSQTKIIFQNGPISEVGVNGISNEALLAIVEHRLQGFQSGEYACRENAMALTKLQEAMMWLHKRTRDRIERGVEGTHTV